ncbi:MAG: ATP-dependent dethiobiotin synthetase BioD [Nitrospira sp.]|nr:MAG: ATP-dependent dethiobiotin synthetase BioD [Nitrospira sp.]
MSKPTGMRQFPSVFITGTDTGVGKTLVAAALARYLSQRGIDVGVMKPVETGVVRNQPSDAGRLIAAAQVSDSIDLVRPYAFRLPVAPLDAARGERRTIKISTIVQAYRTLYRQHDLMLIEGVGGVQVPITPTMDVLDLIEKLEVPVIMVGRTGLGGVNHALLTLMALRARQIPIVALMLNRVMPVKTAVARRQERSTIGLLREFTKVPMIGPLPYVSTHDGEWISAVRKIAKTAAIKQLAGLITTSAR